MPTGVSYDSNPQTDETYDSSYSTQPKYTTLDTRQVVERIDAMTRELETMRRQITAVPRVAVASGLTQELFGAAGKSTRDEYDMNLDWKRFAEWQLR